MGEKGKDDGKPESAAIEGDRNKPKVETKRLIEKPEIRESFLTNHNRPALKNPDFYKIRKVKGIIWHWTGNIQKGAHAEANRNYFNTTQRKASAHFIIDDTEIVQCLPLNEVGYHCGDRPKGVYMPAGIEMIRGTKLTPNFFTIGLELCVNSDSDFKETLRRAIHLTRWLKQEFKVPIYRHFDITGKKCSKHKVHGKWKLLDKRDWKIIQEITKI